MKWGTAAYSLLRFIYWTASLRKIPRTKETRSTIAIAQLKKGQGTPLVAIAGNLAFYPKTNKEGEKDFDPVEGLGIEPGVNPDPVLMQKIKQLLIDHEILSANTEFLFLKNPFADEGHMRRHAEMQLTRLSIIKLVYSAEYQFLFRLATTKKYKIEHLGVSKPPCCMCNTVLSRNMKMDLVASITKDVSKDDISEYYKTVHQAVFPTHSEPVASGPQITKSTINDSKRISYFINSPIYSTEPMFSATGLQFGWDDIGPNSGSWHHPKHPDSWKAIKYTKTINRNRYPPKNLTKPFWLGV